MKEGVIVLVFDPSMDWLRRSSVSKYTTVRSYTIISIPTESIIYDLSLLTPSQQREFVERFNRALVEYQISSTKEKWYFCIFEEAHTYFYQGSMRSKTMQYTVRALTQGRNFKISMALVTQFSSMLDKDTMKFMVQRYFGVSNEPNDVGYLRGFLGKDADQLKTLDNGSFLYFHKGKISKLSIQPYESKTPKMQIKIPQSTPIEPTKPKEQISAMPFLKLGMILCFIVLLLGVRR
jgi:DNA helicase HerA-like ATPase